MPSHSFEKLIGQIVSNCGTLEVLTNSLIHSLGKDPVLTHEIMDLPFGRRISILRKLMLTRTSLSHPEVEILCQELKRIAEERNLITHNPIYHQDAALYVGVMRGFYGDPNRKRLNEADLEKVFKRTQHAIENLTALNAPAK
jgi:hypothetical protein